MNDYSRAFTEYEQEAWDEFDRILDSIPNGRMYDSVSVMKAFPELSAAFDKARAMGTFYRLQNK